MRNRPWNRCRSHVDMGIMNANKWTVPGDMGQIKSPRPKWTSSSNPQGPLPHLKLWRIHLGSTHVCSGGLITLLKYVSRLRLLEEWDVIVPVSTFRDITRTEWKKQCAPEWHPSANLQHMKIHVVEGRHMTNQNPDWLTRVWKDLVSKIPHLKRLDCHIRLLSVQKEYLETVFLHTHFASLRSFAFRDNDYQAPNLSFLASLPQLQELIIGCYHVSSVVAALPMLPHLRILSMPLKTVLEGETFDKLLLQLQGSCCISKPWCLPIRVFSFHRNYGMPGMRSKPYL